LARPWTAEKNGPLENSAQTEGGIFIPGRDTGVIRILIWPKDRGERKSGRREI